MRGQVATIVVPKRAVTYIPGTRRRNALLPRGRLAPAGPPGCDLPVGTGSWLSERALHACRKFQARGHFYGQFWQAFPKGFRRPKATTFLLKFPGRAARADPSVRQRRRLAERALHAPALTGKSHLGGPGIAWPAPCGMRACARRQQISDQSAATSTHVGMQAFFLSGSAS